MLTNIKCDDFSINMIIDDLFKRMKTKNSNFFDINETKSIFNELYKSLDMHIEFSTEDIISLLKYNNFNEYKMTKDKLKEFFNSIFGKSSSNNNWNFNLFHSKDELENLESNLEINHIINNDLKETKRVDFSEKYSGNKIYLEPIKPGLLKFIKNMKFKSVNDIDSSDLNLSKSVL